MTKRPVTNLPASVHDRLNNLAKKEGRLYNELLQYYVRERFLYRLSVSPFSERFVLEGAARPRHAYQTPELLPPPGGLGRGGRRRHPRPDGHRR